MFAAPIDTHGKEIAILAEYPLLRSYPALLVAMIAEVSESATEEQRDGFFAAIGARIAAMTSVADIEDGELLGRRMNDLWDALGWGDVRLEFHDEGIDILHRNLPTSIDRNDEGLWTQVAPAILTGAYETWFRSLGSGPNLTTRILRQGAGFVELRHGF